MDNLFFTAACLTSCTSGSISHSRRKAIYRRSAVVSRCKYYWFRIHPWRTSILGLLAFSAPQWYVKIRGGKHVRTFAARLSSILAASLSKEYFFTPGAQWLMLNIILLIRIHEARCKVRAAMKLSVQKCEHSSCQCWCWLWSVVVVKPESGHYCRLADISSCLNFDGHFGLTQANYFCAQEFFFSIVKQGLQKWPIRGPFVAAQWWTWAA